MEYFNLNAGFDIPAVGTGSNSFGKETSDYTSAYTGDFTPLYNAIENGYTLFDCAKAYGNETGMGDALIKSGLKRSDYYIINKIPNKPEFFADPAAVRGCVESSLKAFHTDYFDIYMIHQPISRADQQLGLPMKKDEILMVYTTIVELCKEGKIRAAAVSNFTVSQLQFLIENTSVIPAVDQIRCNPAARNRDIVEYCKAQGILPMAHSPMNFSVAAGKKDADAAEKYRILAGKIGEKYGKTWGQVLLRYDFQSGIGTIPKSHRAVNQKLNIDIFDFSLTDEEMSVLY